MDALRHLGELERVAEQDERPAPRCPSRARRRGRSGRPRRPRACRASRRAPRARRATRCRRRAATSGSRTSSSSPGLDVLALVGLSPCLTPWKSSPSSRGRALDLVEQVVDHLVALRRDPDLLPCARAARDQPRAAVRLARPGRPLDEEVGVRRGRRASARCSSSSRPLHASRRRAAGRAAAAAEVRVAAVAGEHRGGEPAQRRPLRLRVDTGRRGRAPSAAARRASPSPRRSTIVPVALSIAVTVQPVPSSAGSSPAVAVVEVVLLRRET